MNILSLFDGISCGRVALERAGIPITRYYASEIDKYAIQVAQKNYPDTVQLGDVREVRFTSYGESKSLDTPCRTYWMLNYIDILLAGFPCQSFSSAGKRKGFEDERGNLFFEALRIFHKTKPRFFLFENVASMSKDTQEIISGHLGVKPIEINSSLVSAQNRKRIYWVGRRMGDGTYEQVQIAQPEDRGIFLSDVLEENVDEKYIIEKSFPTHSILCDGGHAVTGCSMRGRYLVDGKRADHLVESMAGMTQQRIEIRNDGKAPCLTSIQKDSLVATKMAIAINQNRKIDSSSHKIRKLTPIECERLQTLPDGYTAGVSDTQRYKVLGNAWTVDVIAHILRGIQ